jgi:hypothetical protein
MILIVPWMRRPAVVADHASARRRASAKSMNLSPAKNDPFT